MAVLHAFDVFSLQWCRHTEDYEEVEEEVTETIRVYRNDAYEDTRTSTYDNDAYEYNNEDQMSDAAKLSASAGIASMSASAAMASKSTMSASVNMSTVTTTQSSNSRISSSSSSDTEKYERYKRPPGGLRY
eukprot:2753254-Pyramimonas_sp.AAC.1